MCYTIITMKTNAERRFATANTRTVALTAKQTAAPASVVMNSVMKKTKNFTTSNRNPAQQHTFTSRQFVGKLSEKKAEKLSAL